MYGTHRKMYKVRLTLYFMLSTHGELQSLKSGDSGTHCTVNESQRHFTRPKDEIKELIFFIAQNCMKKLKVHKSA